MVTFQHTYFVDPPHLLLFLPLQARCLDNVCPHRGAPLSNGWVKPVEGHGNCVVCPYHGWAFDKEGKLGEVPSNANGASFPKRSLVDAYPVEERGG